MKKCIYPLVVYPDKEEQCYIGIYQDLDLIVSGETVEEVYVSAEETLAKFLELTAKFENEMSDASSYEDAVKLNPRRIVLLADAEVDKEQLVLTDDDQKYKHFLSEMLVEQED